jgi:hypothetical protein
MQVLASPEAVAFVRARGGALFVWVDTLATQGAVRYLAASTESPGPVHTFRRMTGGDFELFLDAGELDLPEQIQVEVRGVWRKHLRASWNGATFPSNPRTLDGRSPEPG